jgi:DNA-binding MarR family transcriptional regulator
MKRRYERTVGGGWVTVLIPETLEDEEEIARGVIRGEVNDYASFGDIRAEVAAAAPRLSRLQRRILTWLVAEDQRTRGTMAASHQDLVRALVARGVDKGNASTSLKGLEVKGLVTITRTPGGHAEAVDLTAKGRHRVAALTPSCE